MAFLVEFNLPQLSFSACIAAAKFRPVLHYCVVIFSEPRVSWSVCCVSGVACVITTDEHLQ